MLPAPRGPGGNSRIRYWFPAVSIAASAAALAIVAVVFLSPAPVAYSFEKTAEAIRNTSGIHMVIKFRHGPAQPLPASAGGEGTTTAHPANPFAEAEMLRTVKNGREMSYTRSSNRELIRNGPLHLTIESATGERKFTLSGSSEYSPGDDDPENLFFDLDEQVRRGEIEYKVAPKPDSSSRSSCGIGRWERKNFLASR